jgi:hypothetical protein
MGDNEDTGKGVKESGTDIQELQSEQTPECSKPRNAIGLINWLIIVCLMVLSSTASVAIYDRYYANRLVAFDLQGYLLNQRLAMQKNQLTEKQLGENLDALKAKLDNIPANQAVITADVVLRNIEVLKLE